MINYKDEYSKLLAKNPITSLPPQEIIDDSKEVALLIWNNFYEDSYRYDRDDYFKIDLVKNYELYKVNELFSFYKNDVDFWKTVLLNNNNLIFSENFKKDFSNIYKTILQDKSFIISLYEKNEEIELLSLIELSEDEKTTIEKNHLLKKSSVYFSEIKNFSLDKDFLLQLLKTKHQSNNRAIYKELPEEYKKDREIIKLCVFKNDWEAFLSMPLDIQKELFNGTKNWNKSIICSKLMTKFIWEHQEELLQDNIQILRDLLNKSFSKYSKIAKSKIQKNISLLSEFEKQHILNILDEEQDNGIKLLTDYIKKFKKTAFSKGEEKVFSIISNYIKEKKESFEILKVELNKSLYYRIANNKLNNTKISEYDFNRVFINIFDMYQNKEINYEQAESLSNGLKKSLTIDSLKELRLPKNDLFSYLKSKHLSNILNESLEKNNNKGIKTKI